MLLVASLRPGDGKTALAAGLARILYDRGVRAMPFRIYAGDTIREGPQADARLYSLLPFVREPLNAPIEVEQAAVLAGERKDGLLIAECDATLSTAAIGARLHAKVALVIRYENGLDMIPVKGAILELGDRFLGLVVTAVPERRRADAASAMAGEGIDCLGMLPDDDVLASFTVAQLQDALAAQLLVDGDMDQVIGRVVIGPVSADPGRSYFSRFACMAAITRSHKPDLQLAALDAGAVALVAAGGSPPLEYVIERAAGDGVPLLLTVMPTVESMKALEDIYGRSRFQGPQKVERAAQVIGESLDITRLEAALGLSEVRSG